MGKARVTIDSFDFNSIGNETEYLKTIINAKEFLLFLKSDCPISGKLKQLLDSYEVKYNAMYLDSHVNGHRLQGKLFDWTGKDLPNVYVKTIFIGGYEETVEIISTGLLNDLTNGIDVSKFDFDLIVIGGGTSGIAAALESAKFGKKVALCDFPSPTRHGTTWGLGGSPAGSGSPSKTIFHRASLLPHDFADASFFGWEVGKAEKFNWAKISETLEEHMKSVSWIQRKLLREAGVQYINGWGRFVDNHTLAVTDVNSKVANFTSKTFIIATGSKHRQLGIHGEEMNSLSVEDALSLNSFEGSRAIVIGSGKDGLEIVGILSGLQIETSLVVRRTILPGFDVEMASKITKILKSQGVRVLNGVTVVSIAKFGENVRVEGKWAPKEQRAPSALLEFSQRKLSELGSRRSPPPIPTEGDNQMETSSKAGKDEPASTQGQEAKNEIHGSGDRSNSKMSQNPESDADFIEDFDLVIVAAGRQPNVADMGLHKLNVKLESSSCKIMVNCFDQTSVENIFAVGQVSNAMNSDVRGVAKKAAQLLARRMFNMSTVKMDYRKIPTLILTPVEYAFIGETEDRASEIHGKIEVYHEVISTDRTSLSNRFDNRGYVKIICTQPVPNIGSLVVGMHILSPRAGEILQGFVPYFRAGCLTKEQMDEMVGLHPSEGEAFSCLSITKSSGREVGLDVI